ncbi:MAG: hypothetical protein AAF560_06800 [Acidobacteriota bacterium]
MKLKSLVLTLSMLVLASVAVSLSANLGAPPAPKAPIVLNEPPPVCAADDVMSFGTTPMWAGPNVCGDPCSNPGQEVGCVNRNVSPWQRVICICSNGFLTC